MSLCHVQVHVWKLSLLGAGRKARPTLDVNKVWRLFASAVIWVIFTDLLQTFIFESDGYFQMSNASKQMVHVISKYRLHVISHDVMLCAFFFYHIRNVYYTTAVLKQEPHHFICFYL